MSIFDILGESSSQQLKHSAITLALSARFRFLVVLLKRGALIQLIVASVSLCLHSTHPFWSMALSHTTAILLVWAAEWWTKANIEWGVKLLEEIMQHEQVALSQVIRIEKVLQAHGIRTDLFLPEDPQDMHQVR